MELNYDKYAIVLVGTGATGSNLLPFLCQLANNFPSKMSIVIADGDSFERKNIKNQKCTVFDVGVNKAKVLCERYQKVYKDIKIKYKPDFLMNKEDLKELIFTAKRSISSHQPASIGTIVIGAVDNNASRRVINDYYENCKEDVIYIDAGNGTIDREGQVVVGFKSYITEIIGENPKLDRKYVTYEHLKPACKVFKEILTDSDTLDSLSGCGAVVDEHPQNICTNIMSATMIFTVVNEIVTFNKINSHQIYFDAVTGKTNTVKAKDYNVKEFREKLLEKI